jgi:hypothetical protein
VSRRGWMQLCLTGCSRQSGYEARPSLTVADTKLVQAGTGGELRYHALLACRFVWSKPTWIDRNN